MKKYLLLLLLASFSVEAQIVNIPDANFKAKLLEASPSNTIAQNSFNQYIKIDVNNDGEIQESEALLVRRLNVSNASISSLEGINSFLSIEQLRVNNNNLTSLHLNGFNSLSLLDISNNQIVSQSDLYITSNYYDSLSLNLSNNLLTSFNLNLFLIENSLSELLIMFLNLNNNPFDIVDLSSDSEISSIYVELRYTSINSLIGNLKDVNGLYIENNPFLQTVNLNLNSNNNFIELLSIHNNQSLEEVTLYSDFFIQNGNTMDITINDNILLNDLNIINISSLGSIGIRNCPLNNLNIQNSKFLVGVSIEQVQTESMDLSSFLFYSYYIHNCPNLLYLNLKNGINIGYDSLNLLPELKYICVDEGEIESFQNILSVFFPNVQVNSYCSFVPGGEFYSIQGNTKIDLENNVCDENDIDFPSMKFNITNGSISGTIISNTSGNYSIPVQAGTHTITPVFENPTYFNVSPPSVAVTFPAQTSPFAQNFCVTPNGVHQDVEVVIVPLDAARPGFDASYGLVYKNKGNTTVSGSISLTYMDNVMDFLEANPIQSSIEPNILTWNYTNLQPFETRYITVSFNLNSPQETPALNGGEILNFTAIIDPISGDEMVSDNTSTLNQEVVNSYDPNDKTCLEGSVISTELIGQYVHYVIRFENTGTFFAQNVVVKDEIDVSKFDLNSLIVLSASHQQWTRINGNKVEFIFENIQLPFPPSEERHGYIAFKIKLKNNLTVGDTFSNFASIYFDYNFPIITEPATTTIEALSNPDFEFSNFVKLYPNPASATIIIESQTINLKSVEIFNSFGQLIQAIPNDNNQLSIDVSNLSTGTYFVKVHSDKGVGVSKFVKQ